MKYLRTKDACDKQVFLFDETRKFWNSAKNIVLYCLFFTVIVIECFYNHYQLLIVNEIRYNYKSKTLYNFVFKD